MDYTIGMNSLEEYYNYNFMKIDQWEHRHQVTIMKEDHFDNFNALKEMETTTLDHHESMYCSNDRSNMCVWYDCSNREHYGFGWGIKRVGWSYVSETSEQTGVPKMKIMTNGSEGEIEEMMKVSAAVEFGKGWFSFRDMNHNRSIDYTQPMMEVRTCYSK